MPFSLRLDPDTEALLRRLAASTGLSKANVVREAVAQYGVEVAPPRSGDASAFDRLKPFVGAVGTGGANLSTDTHAKYRTLLAKKQRASRSR